MYGDSKPSEDAIDRMVSKINKEYVGFSFFRTSEPTHFLASTRKANFHARGSTRTKETLLTSMRPTVCSIRRFVYSSDFSLMHHANFHSTRLHGTTTNTPQKFGPVSNVVPHCSTIIFGCLSHLIYTVVCVLLSDFMNILLKRPHMLCITIELIYKNDNWGISRCFVARAANGALVSSYHQ